MSESAGAPESLTLGVVEWPDGLLAHSDDWRRIRDEVTGAAPDLLITNELPFGEWLASDPTFDNDRAARSIEAHAAGLAALAALPVAAVLTSRPRLENGRLVNEAVLIGEGVVTPLRSKQVFPQEAGWWETEWFRPGRSSVAAVPVGSINAGVLLCTELMFTERARLLARAGAGLIAAPRASGEDPAMWLAAAAMASITGGVFVASSNRTGQASATGPRFGGRGFVFAPGGVLMGETGPDRSILTVSVSPSRVLDARNAYPCYVGDWPTDLGL